MQHRCATCPRPVPDTAYGCSACASDLAQKLDQLSALLPELIVTISKQDRMGAGGARPSGAEQPLPYRAEAAERAWAIRGELTTWARLVHDETGRYRVGDTDAALARYLGEAVDWARYRPSWPEFHAALRPLLGRAFRLVDKAEPKIYLGPCRMPVGESGTCWTDVLAKVDALTGTCPSCGAVHEVRPSREWLLRSLMDVLLPVTEIATVLRGFGDVKVGYSTIAAYAADRLIVAHGDDGHGRPRYRVGDVLEVRARLRKRSPGRQTVDERMSA